MIRVVLDTNILISALLQPQGLPARTFVMVLAGTTAQLCVSGVHPPVRLNLWVSLRVADVRPVRFNQPNMCGR
jgi:hypothetical protein